MWLWKSRKPVRSQTVRPTVILPTAGGPVTQIRCTDPSPEDAELADGLGDGEVLRDGDRDEQHEDGSEGGPHEVAHTLAAEGHDDTGADDAGDEPAEVGLPRDTGVEEAERGVDRDRRVHRRRGTPEVPVEHEERPEEPEDGPGGAHDGGQPGVVQAGTQTRDRGRAGHERDGDLPADAADQVERGEAGATEHRLEVLPEGPQGEHVEQDVEDRLGGVQEGRGDEAPRLGPPEERREGEVLRDARVGALREVDDRADADDRVGDDGGAVGRPSAEDGACAGRGPGGFAYAVDALDADGGGLRHSRLERGLAGLATGRVVRQRESPCRSRPWAVKLWSCSAVLLEGQS